MFSFNILYSLRKPIVIYIVKLLFAQVLLYMEPFDNNFVFKSKRRLVGV